MFKSVFSKYVTAFMLIILVSFLVVLIITASAIGRFSSDTKEDFIKNSNEIATSYISSMLHSSGSDDISSFEQVEMDNINETLESISFNTGDMSTIVLDNNGNVVFKYLCKGTKVSFSGKVSKEIINDLTLNEYYYGEGDFSGFFEDANVLCGSVIKNADGAVCGYVFTCSDSVMMLQLWELLVKIIMGSILWVLFAALIAVYFISARVISPLREISGAAKNFAKGKFDVRVPVRGSDEVAELAETFNNMAESLDNYDNMRNMFMSDVSHDLRSPMTSIAGFIDGILDGVIPPEQHEYYLRMISNEVHRLSRLVTSLLNLSRIQAGDRKFTKTRFDICEKARLILISFEKQIDEKRLEVEFEPQDDRMYANADSDAIYQVLYNICHNAVKFSSEGGKLKISISRLKGKKLLIEVYNDGKGIPADELQYVFERFYKSDKSRGLDKSGSGLGLFISKTIIDAHEESIWVESEYGKNCCFKFTLSGE